MPINYFSVKRHLLENGWELLSTEYKNLKTPLKMKCPNGHEVEQTYEFWRENMLCDECLRGDENVKITLFKPLDAASFFNTDIIKRCPK